MSEEEFAPAICPFCGQPFKLPRDINVRHNSSCGCGAVFEIVYSDDVADSTMAFEDGDLEVRTIPRIDKFGVTKDDPNPEWATAVFAKKKE